MRLMHKTSDIGDPLYRNSVVPSRRSARQIFSFQSKQMPKKRKLKPEENSARICRDSKQQLNVALDGKFYEKAKSRRVRQKEALQQSGDQDEAIPLGRSKHGAPTTTTTTTRTSAKSLEVSDLEKQFEQKSFSRRATIAHNLKQQQKEALEGLAKTPKRPSTLLKAYKGKQAKAKPGPGKTSSVMKDAPKSKIKTTLKEESCAEVIDLLTDSEDDENDGIRSLAQCLQTEAIGHGANRKEMQVYAQELNKLGLHSREMILYFFNSLDIAERRKYSAAMILNDRLNQEVSNWKWMKPFHKTVFQRWVRSQRCLKKTD